MFVEKLKSRTWGENKEEDDRLLDMLLELDQEIKKNRKSKNNV